MATTAAVPGWLRVPDDANALAPQVWPERAHRDADGRLVVAGVAATELAERFGTPLYVVDEADARARAARILAAFEAAAASVGTTVTVYYAGKAFLSARDRALGHRGGPRASTCAPAASSPSRSPRAPTPPASDSTATTSRVAEIERAVAAGVGAIVIDSEIEIERVADAAARAGRVQRVRAAREQRRARLDARVPRHRPRGPEVRRLPRPRRRARHAHPRARLARLPRACTATSARRSSTPPGSPSRPSACSPRTPSSRRAARCPS